MPLSTFGPSEIGAMIYPACITKSRTIYGPYNLYIPTHYIVPSSYAGSKARWPLPYFVYRIRTNPKNYCLRRFREIALRYNDRKPIGFDYKESRYIYAPLWDVRYFALAIGGIQLIPYSFG